MTTQMLMLQLGGATGECRQDKGWWERGGEAQDPEGRGGGKRGGTNCNKRYMFKRDHCTALWAV